MRIVDKAPGFSVGSRGDGLQPRTLEVFEDLGVLDEVLVSGIDAPVMRVYADGQAVREGRMAEPVQPRPDVPYPNVWLVPQEHPGPQSPEPPLTPPHLRNSRGYSLTEYPQKPGTR